MSCAYVIQKEELNEREKFYISKYDTTNNTKGYNLTHGGDRPLVSEDTLRKKYIVK